MTKFKTNFKSFQVHPYHLVEPSPWPLGASISSLTLSVGGVLKFHGYYAGDISFPLGIIGVIATMWLWWSDVVNEATYQGHHTKTVKYGITLGIILFIITEILLFISFFWAFFHSSLSPSIELGSIWPPVGIEPINPFEVPLLNTIILLASGATITVSHAKIISGDRSSTIIYLILTILLAWLFLGLQYTEYLSAPFTIADSIFGSTFYILTGWHGLHVLIGTLFLTVSSIRMIQYHVTHHHHLGYEAAIVYWHCVDVIWIFLFISVYIFGSNI